MGKHGTRLFIAYILPQALKKTAEHLDSIVVGLEVFVLACNRKAPTRSFGIFYFGNHRFPISNNNVSSICERRSFTQPM